MHKRIVNKHGYVLELSTQHESCQDCNDLMAAILGNNLHAVSAVSLTTNDNQHLARLVRVGADAWGGTDHRFINTTTPTTGEPQ